MKLQIPQFEKRLPQDEPQYIYDTMRTERMAKIRCAAYDVAAGIHLIGMFAGILFVQPAEGLQLKMLILAIIYCAAGTFLFSILAGGKEDDERNDNK